MPTQPRSPLEAEMIKRIALFLCLTAMLTLAAAAQNAAIKGLCKDEAGKPIASGTVEFANLASGQKIRVATGQRGEYNSTEIPAGNYKITLFGPDGKPLFYFDNAPIKAASEYVVDFELSKLKAEAEKESAGNAEQRKQNEKVKQDNEKIRSTNALLQQAAQQKKDQQYAAALDTLQRAAAQDQTHDVVYAALADACVLNKKFPEAEAAYTKAIALAPAGSKSLGSDHSGLALALAQQGKIEPSMAECEKTAQFDAVQGGVCYFNDGAILTNQGNADAANEAFDKSIAADPTRADAYYQKGVNLLAKATLGSDNKMIPAPGTVEAFSKYLELSPDGKYAQSAKDLLTSIGATVQASYGEAKKSGKKKN
jgi:tetratricopeptide (TPR) repeat protein